MDPKPSPAEDKDELSPFSVGTVPPQNRALAAVRDSTVALGGEMLLDTTGPLAELKSAERRGILDEARRILIAKKGRGVVFEAHTLAQLQEASERFDLKLTAQLAKSSNSPRADLWS